MAVKDTLVYVVNMCLQIDNIKTKILAIKVNAISLNDLRKRTYT
jgi:hypothetical protein